MGGKKDDLIFEFSVASFNFADDVAGVPLLLTFPIKVEFAGDVLNVAAFVAGRRYADFAQLRSEIGGGEQFVMGAAAASLHSVTGKKFHSPADLGLVCARFLGGKQRTGNKKHDE